MRRLTGSPAVRIVGAVLILASGGIVGYMFIEGWSLLDSAYMMVLTLTTVGYEEVHPLSTGGRIFSIFLMITGVGVAMYAVTAVARRVVEEEVFRGFLRRRRMRTRMAGMRGHVIVCGYGRVGRQVVSTLVREKVDCIVLDHDSQVVGELAEQGLLYVQGDATRDETLLAAGAPRARAVVVALGNDSDNVLITLSARALNPSLNIVSRTGLGENEEKLRRAGADRVVSPYSLGGRRLALSAIRPAAVDYFDSLADSGGADERLEEVLVAPGSPLDGITVGQCARTTGVHVLALKKGEGALEVSPGGAAAIQAGDLLIVFGSREQLAPLEGSRE